ncbi:MAG: hypothetical protein SFV15_15285 [Polyangiaceae bacterium]|nr:hypothetical protein [Polyangiaceae bacterium]
MALCVGVAAATQTTLPSAITHERDIRRALVGIVRAEKAREASPEEVRILDQSPGLRRGISALLRAHTKGSPNDLFLVKGELSPEGYLLRATDVYTLTDTEAADESRVKVAGSRVLFTAGTAGSVRLGFLDLSGQAPPLDWPWLARLQAGVTNLQEAGTWTGIRRTTLLFETNDAPDAYAFDRDRLALLRGTHTQFVPGSMGSESKFDAVRAYPKAQALPPRLLNWGIDRLRAISWVGDEQVQLLKALGFKLLERARGVFQSSDNGAEEIQAELGPPRRVEAARTEEQRLELGFPPLALAPLATPSLPGEGEWRSLEGDPFIKTNATYPNPFATTFLRTDRNQPMSEVYITLWDPRQVALSAVSGTDEPRSATGVTGSGLIPRARIGHLVAAFNGAFLGRHGRFGMKSEGEVLIPPKPFAATIAELPGGVTGFGTWPATPTPAGPRFISLRQNLTPLIADGVQNPYARHFWGGTPEGWEDDARTLRSGLCLTREAFVAYFYGNALAPKQLSSAMQQARCDYGVHLDMNPGHVGLEFYHIERAGKLPILRRALEPEWESQGSVPELPGYEFQARRMLRYMSLMHFPRYLTRQTRDFFYLTLKQLLPGPALTSVISPPLPNEGQWSTSHAGPKAWPPALARTEIRVSPKKPTLAATAISLDPKLLEVVRDVPASPSLVCALRTPTQPFVGSSSLWLADGAFVISKLAPNGQSVQWLTSGWADTDPRLTAATGALAVTREGMLLVIELPGAAELSGPEFSDFMKLQGADTILLLARKLGLSEGGAPLARGVIQLVRGRNSAVERLFPNTPVVPASEWAPLQRP